MPTAETWSKTLKKELPGLERCQFRFSEHNQAYFDRTNETTSDERAKGDCGFINAFGEDKTIEIKTDTTTYAQKNFFLETMSVVEKNILGWMFTSKADFLFYYFSNRNEEYLFDMPLLKEWFHKLYGTGEFQHSERQSSTYSDNGKLLYHTKGLAISADVVLRDNALLTFEGIFNR